MAVNKRAERRYKKYMVGYRPAVYAREGRMLGIRQPLDGPVFEKLEHAEQWCKDGMIDHYDRGLAISDAKIEPFKGMVSLWPTAESCPAS